MLDHEQFTQSHEPAHWQALLAPAESRLALAIADLEQAVDVELAADVKQEEHTHSENAEDDISCWEYGLLMAQNRLQHAFDYYDAVQHMLYLAQEDTTGLSCEDEEDKATKNTRRPRKDYHRAQSRRLCVNTRHSHSYARWRKLETRIDLYHPDLRPTRRKEMPNYFSWKMSRARNSNESTARVSSEQGHARC